MDIPENKLIVKQIVEAVEIFSGFETKNRFSINDETGRQLYYAFEESNWFIRQFGACRPMKITVIDNNKHPVLSIEKKWHIFLSNFNIMDETGRIIAKLKQTKFFMTAWFDIIIDGVKAYSMGNQIIHPWTFKIMQDDAEMGQILKKWSGMGKEMFTDADNFLVDFGSIPRDKRAIILACAFAIDIIRFERKARR
jgi:uncharacterized protein YxjI